MDIDSLRAVISGYERASERHLPAFDQFREERAQALRHLRAVLEPSNNPDAASAERSAARQFLAEINASSEVP